MPQRTKTQPRRPTPRRDKATVSEELPARRDVVKDIDEILDEVDTVLEENSWVRCYIQKGGE